MWPLNNSENLNLTMNMIFVCIANSQIVEESGYEQKLDMLIISHKLHGFVSYKKETKTHLR